MHTASTCRIRSVSFLWKQPLHTSEYIAQIVSLLRRLSVMHTASTCRIRSVSFLWKQPLHTSEYIAQIVGRGGYFPTFDAEFRNQGPENSTPPPRNCTSNFWCWVQKSWFQDLDFWLGIKVRSSISGRGAVFGTEVSAGNERIWNRTCAIVMKESKHFLLICRGIS